MLSKLYIQCYRSKSQKIPLTLSVPEKCGAFLSSDFKDKDAGFMGIGAESTTKEVKGPDKGGPEKGSEGRGRVGW